MSNPHRDGIMVQVSSSDLLSLITTVTALKGEVARLTEEATRRNGTLEKALATMVDRGDIHRDACGMRFTRVEEELFPGLYRRTRVFWGAMVGVVAGLNLLFLVLTKVAGW